MISRKATVSAAALLLASAGAAAAFPATSTTSLNVRSGPGTGYGVVDTLQPGQTVDVIDQRGSWYQLADGGWASGNFLDAEGSAAVEVDRYAVVDYPRNYGAPLFYYGNDPFFWDDAGYYWYWREGRRHRVGWDWFDRHDRDDFRWANARYRRDFERRWGDRDDDERLVRRDRDRGLFRDDDDDGDRMFRGDDDRRMGRMDDDEDDISDARRLERVEREGVSAEAEGRGNLRSGRASSDVEAGTGTELRRGEGNMRAGARAEGGARAAGEDAGRAEGQRRILREDIPGGGY